MQPASQQLPEIQKKLRIDIEQLRLEAKTTLRSIEIDFPDYAELISPKPSSISRVQKALRPNEVLITWFVGHSQTYIWAIQANGDSYFKSTSLTRQQLKLAVTTLRKALDPQVTSIDDIPTFDFRQSYELYKLLIQPVAAALENKDTIVLVPHDEIGQLPLGVLTEHGFLLESEEIGRAHV